MSTGYTLIHHLNKEDEFLRRRLIDSYTLAMSNCASALCKSLDYLTRYVLFAPSQFNTAQPGEWQTLRDISDFDARDSWSLWITNACVAYILLSGLVVAGDTFATFIHFEWSLMSPLNIIYWCYWVLAGIASLLMCLAFIIDTPDLDDMLDLLMFWFFLLYIPFLIFGCIEYVVALLICHRSINFKENIMELKGSSIAKTSIGLVIVLILLILSPAFIPVIYFSVIATSNGLELFNVYNRVLAEAVTLGVVAWAIACSQWALYKSVRSINFFGRFAIAREQRDPAMKLHSVIGLKPSGRPIPREERDGEQ